MPVRAVVGRRARAVASGRASVGGTTLWARCALAGGTGRRTGGGDLGGATPGTRHVRPHRVRAGTPGGRGGVGCLAAIVPNLRARVRHRRGGGVGSLSRELLRLRPGFAQRLDRVLGDGPRIDELAKTTFCGRWVRSYVRSVAGA